MSVKDAFEGSVAYYDDWIRLAVPGYPEVFEVAVASLPFPDGEELSLLDLGAGTGLFTWHVLQRYSNARCVLVDVAGGMLDVAKKRFDASDNIREYLTADYRDAELPGGHGLVISSLSIHHLQHEEKQALFKRVAGLLRPGGVFVNIDQIRAPTGALAELYWEDWITRVRAAGGSEEQLAASIERRRQFDVDASLDEQLTWLQAAGFQEVDLLYKFGFIGLFWARVA